MGRNRMFKVYGKVNSLIENNKDINSNLTHPAGKVINNKEELDEFSLF